MHAAWHVAHGRFWTAPENAAWLEASTALAAHFAERPDVRYGLTAMCVGLGQGGSVIWENPHYDGKKRK